MSFRIIWSDNGTENVSTESQNYCACNGAHDQPLLAYMPVSNGTVEKLVQ